MNNLASIRNCHRGERYVLLSPGPTFWSLLTFYFPMFFRHFFKFT